MWKRGRSTDKRYSGDNRLILPKSPHRRKGLAPQQHLGWAVRNVGHVSANNGGAHACASEWRSKLGNTVGSLSEVQREIIVGSLLGDGAMRCKTNALLEINHSSHQRSYGHLADLVRTPPKARKSNGSR